MRSGHSTCARPVLHLVLRGLCIMLPMAATATVAACTPAPPHPPEIGQLPRLGPLPAGQTIRLTGRRVTAGNAVDCPEIETPDGQRHAVSFLSAAIAIGGRVTVRGVYGISTRCTGQVLIVQEEIPQD